MSLNYPSPETWFHKRTNSICVWRNFQCKHVVASKSSSEGWDMDMPNAECKIKFQRDWLLSNSQHVLGSLKNTWKMLWSQDINLLYFICFLQGNGRDTEAANPIGWPSAVTDSFGSMCTTQLCFGMKYTQLLVGYGSSRLASHHGFWHDNGKMNLRLILWLIHCYQFPYYAS